MKPLSKKEADYKKSVPFGYPPRGMWWSPEVKEGATGSEDSTRKAILWDFVRKNVFEDGNRWSGTVRELKNLYPDTTPEDIAELLSEVKRYIEQYRLQVQSKRKGLSLHDALQYFSQNKTDKGHVTQVDLKEHKVYWEDGSATDFDETVNLAHDLMKKSSESSGFLDGPVDLGKHHEGDFPAVSWLPSGQGDTPGLSTNVRSSSLSKESDLKEYSNRATKDVNDYILRHGDIMHIVIDLSKQAFSEDDLVNKLASALTGIIEDFGIDVSEVRWDELAYAYYASVRGGEDARREFQGKEPLVEFDIETLPMLDKKKKFDELLDQLSIETDPQKQKKIKEHIERIKRAKLIQAYTIGEPTPSEHATERGAKEISKYDPEFEFLTKLVAIVAKEGVPLQEIKNLYAAYPFKTIDDAGDLAAKIWTLAVEKYHIPREWLLRKFPERKIKSDLWPAQKKVVPFGYAAPGTFAYEPYKKGAVGDNDTRKSMLWDHVKESFFEKGNRWSSVVKQLKELYPDTTQEDIAEILNHVKYYLEQYKLQVQSSEFGMMDGPVDLGKHHDGDFPSVSWLPSGQGDTPGLSTNVRSSSLIKKAAEEFVSSVQVDIQDEKQLLGREETGFMKEVNIKWQFELEMRNWGVKGVYVHVPDQNIELQYEYMSFERDKELGEYVPETKVVPITNVQVEGLDRASWSGILTPLTLEFSDGKWTVDFGYTAHYASKKINLKKQARVALPYWIDPNGKDYALTTDSHNTWINTNIKMLKEKYGIDFSKLDPKRDSNTSFLIEQGWTRTWIDWGIIAFTVKDLSNLSRLDSFVDNHWVKDQSEYIAIDDAFAHKSYQIVDPFPSLETAEKRETSSYIQSSKSPLSQDQQNEIAASYGPATNVAVTLFDEAIKGGHPRDRAFDYALSETKRMKLEVTPKGLLAAIKTYLN